MSFRRPIGGAPGSSRARIGSASGVSVAPAEFDIRERHEDGRTRLAVTGHLDLATAPALRDRLDQSRAQRRDVRLDLSRVEFVDSSGMKVLIQALKDARRQGVRLDFEGRLTPQVRRMAELTRLDAFR
jgi:anti-anti-sigma factor